MEKWMFGFKDFDSSDLDILSFFNVEDSLVVCSSVALRAVYDPF